MGLIMALNLSDIANNPELLTHKMSLLSGEDVIFRPLKPDDVSSLTRFFANLSAKTREYYTVDNDDASSAQEKCDAINQYDKLRFVVENKITKNIIALLEFSFDTVKDKERFIKYGIKLNTATDCRIGLCIADDYQNMGLGSLFFPYLIDIAKQFGQKRIILWGGVYATNERAIRFYKKNGFKRLGLFINLHEKQSIDMILNI